MFFRMLKKDILERKGLNVILLLFMCLASTLTVCSAVMLYANGSGYENALKKVNAAEVTVLSVQDLNGKRERQEKITDWLKENGTVTDVECSECIRFYTNTVDFAGVEEETVSGLNNRYYYAFSPSAAHNRVVDMDGEFLELPYGTVAVSQYIHNIADVQIGDKVRIITQMGNVYEFIIAAFLKDPATSRWNRFVFNEEDYAVLRKDSPVIEDVYMIDLAEGSGEIDEVQIINSLSEREEEFGELVGSHVRHGYNSDHESAVLLNVVMMISAVFLILMVFMTVSFTIKTAIKNEEKELGMLKALGVESVSFNWLFAAKYLAISLAGTIVGFFGGIYLAGLDLKYLCYGQLMPSFSEIFPTALLSSLMSFLLILFFVTLALRRMKKIGIMDVIAGENRGERFKKLPGIYLHRMKKINIPLYLALTDLTNRIKRYSFLIIAYTMAILLLLVFIEVRDTANTRYWIEKCWGYPAFDFYMDLPYELEEYYIERGGGVKGAYDIINGELAEAGIPAKIDYYYWCNVTTSFNGVSHVSYLQYHIPDGMYSEVYEGVTAKLRNEVMMDAYYARTNGIKIGDTVTVEYYRFQEDGLTSVQVKEDFLVTGLLDKPMAAMTVFMSDAFQDAARYNVAVLPGRINAPENMHADYIEELRELYGATSIWNAEEYVEYEIGDNREEFDLLLWILLPLMTTMIILATALYQSVNFIDETPDIALLKCSGFGNGSIKAWQILRSVMIIGSSSVLAVLFLNTWVLMLLRKAFFTLGHLVKYIPNRHMLRNYVGIPLVLMLLVGVTIYISLGRVKKTEICRIRED